MIINMRTMQLVEITDIEPDARTKLKAKAKRTPKNDMPTAKSLSADRLPSWIQGKFEERIILTLFEHYGADPDPWTVDAGVEGRPSIIEVLQELIDHVCPERHYIVEKGDRIQKIVCVFSARAQPSDISSVS